MGQTRSQQGRLTYHVEQDQQGNWLVEQEGSDRAYSSHNTRSQAVEEGARIAQSHRPSSLVTHNEDYSVDQTNSYS